MSVAERGRGLPHGVVGNGAVTAIVHPDTGIDWLCLPRLDGPSIFGRLLDAREGGSFAFALADEDAAFEAAYLDGTNVLRTEVRSASGAFEVLDFIGVVILASFVLVGASVDHVGQQSNHCIHGEEPGEGSARFG